MTRHRKAHDTKPLDQYLQGLAQGWSMRKETNVCNEWFIWIVSWTHNDTADGLVTIDLKLIPRNRLKTFNVVWLTVRQRISQPRLKCDKALCSRVVCFFFKTNMSTGFLLSLFSPPLLASTSLFLTRLRRITFACCVSSSFGWVQLSIKIKP